MNKSLESKLSSSHPPEIILDTNSDVNNEDEYFLADVTLVQTLSDSFKEQIAIPRHEKVLNKGYTADLRQKFAETDEILSQKRSTKTDINVNFTPISAKKHSSPSASLSLSITPTPLNS